MQNIGNIIAGMYEPYEYEDLTVDNTSGGVSLDSSKIKSNATPMKEAQRIVMTLESASIRYRIDSGAPTTTVGHLLNAGDILIVQGQPAIGNFRAIRTGDTSGTLRCTYER